MCIRACVLSLSVCVCLGVLVLALTIFSYMTTWVRRRLMAWTFPRSSWKVCVSPLPVLFFCFCGRLARGSLSLLRASFRGGRRLLHAAQRVLHEPPLGACTPAPPSCCFCSVCLWSITAPARVAIASPQSRVRTSLARVSDFLPDWVRDCLFSTVWATLGGDGGDGVGAGMRERGGERGSDLHDRIHWHGVFRISPQRRQQRRFTWF